MSLKASTGLRNALLVTGSLKSRLDGGFLKIYSNAVAAPATADAAIPGGAVLLCTISVNSTGTGITMAATATDGVVEKTAAETWSGVNAATGTASWYRHVGSADDGTLSTTQPRLQGSVGTTAADLILASVALTNAQTTTVPNYAVALPTP